MPGSRFCVAALKALQNSIMLRPRGPSAGPIGGDGFALPAGTCSLMIPTIFFAIYFPPATCFTLRLLDLRVFELHRRRAPEDRDCDLEPSFFFVNLLDEPVERGEWSVADAHLLPDFKGNRGLRSLDPLLHLMHDPCSLVIADRRRPPASSEKPGDLSGVLDEMPSLVIHIHLDQHVAWKEFALRAHLSAALDLDHLLCRNENSFEFFGKTLLLGPLADQARDLLFEAGVTVDYVPAARHCLHPNLNARARRSAARQPKTPDPQEKRRQLR